MGRRHKFLIGEGSSPVVVQPNRALKVLLDSLEVHGSLQATSRKRTAVPNSSSNNHIKFFEIRNIQFRAYCPSGLFRQIAIPRDSRQFPAWGHHSCIIFSTLDSCIITVALQARFFLTSNPLRTVSSPFTTLRGKVLPIPKKTKSAHFHRNGLMATQKTNQ